MSSWATLTAVAPILAAAEQIATVLGIGAAGVWAYFNFIKSRTYRPRLQINVSGRIIQHGGRNYLIPCLSIKNVGLCVILVDQAASGLRLSFCFASKNSEPLNWTVRTCVLPVLGEYLRIEPGEVAHEEKDVIPLPQGTLGARIEVRLASMKMEWNTTSIVTVPPALPLHSKERARDRDAEWQRLRWKPGTPFYDENRGSPTDDQDTGVLDADITDDSFSRDEDHDPGKKSK
jgi:hypothetical protein